MNTTPRKWLIGCAIGCGSLLLVAGIAGVGFWFWLSRPGKLLEPGLLMGPDTTGYAVWTLKLEEPGTEPLVTALIEAIQQPPSGGRNPFPQFIESWLRDRQKQEQEEDIRQLFPMTLAWTLESGQNGGELHLLTLSLERAGSRLVMVDWFLGFALGRDEQSELHDYQDERIYRLRLEDDREITFFIRGNDVFFTSDVATAAQAVERLHEKPSAPGAPSAAGELLAALNPGSRLRAVLTNQHGEVPRQMERVLALAGGSPPDRELWSAVHAVRLAGDLQQDGSLEGTLELLGPGEAWARSQAAAFSAELAKLDPERQRLQFQSVAAGDRILVDFRVAELGAALGRGVRSHISTSRIPPPATAAGIPKI